jgi:tRNA pseudouridine55 synthase
VKIDGERAYVRAREGEEMDLAARPLWVESLTLLARPDPDHAELEMVCGKGGYVRSIARDLGRALGCHAHVVTLRRLWSGAFDAEDGVTLDRIEALAHTEALEALLRPLEDGLSDLPEVRCTPEAAARLRNGNPAPVIASDADYGDIAWASEGRARGRGRHLPGGRAPPLPRVPRLRLHLGPNTPAGGDPSARPQGRARDISRARHARSANENARARTPGQVED